MEHDDYLSRWRRSLRGTSIDEVAGRMRAIVGPVATGLAKQAIVKLEAGDAPTPQELAALETLIRMQRPAPLCNYQDVGDIGNANEVFPGWEQFRIAARPYVYCVGRIDAVQSDGSQPPDAVGTGFLISPTVLVTNTHVVDHLSAGTFKLAKGQAIVWFKREYECVPDEASVDITEVIAVHPDLDLAALRVTPLSATDGRHPLGVQIAPLQIGDTVVAIGYPFQDSLRNPLFIGAVYGDRFGVKRSAPGEITSQRGNRIFHDCSTLGGNSGSPLLSMATAQVVGIHRFGTFLYSNEAVDGASLAQFIQPYL